jgi:hypothetical protein
VRRFIPNFVEIVKPLNKLLKKDACFEWENEGKLSFQRIKEAITVAPVLVSPNFPKTSSYFLSLQRTPLQEFCYRRMIKGMNN